MEITNRFNLPQPIIDAARNMAKDYDFVPADNSISVTSLIDDPHVVDLKRKFRGQIHVDITDLLHILKGSAMHNILEKAGSEYIKELRMSKEFTLKSGNNYNISGKLDLFELNGTLTDYKDTSVWSYIYEPKGKPEYASQLNLLAYLLESHGIEVKKLQLIYFLKDWQKNQYLKSRKKGYPEQKVITIPIQKLSKEAVEFYIKERLYEHFEAKPKSACAPDKRWRKPDKWAVMSQTGQKALKLCDTKEEAEEYATTKKNGGIERRTGEDTRCLSYCEVNEFCNYYREHYAHYSKEDK